MGEEGRIYTYRYIYTVTTRMTFTLRWAAMTASLMFHKCEGQSHKRRCPQTTTFEAEKGEPKRIRTEVPLLTMSLTPYRYAKPTHRPRPGS